MNKVTSFSLSSLRSEEIMGFCIEISDKLKALSTVATSAPGIVFLKAIQTYSNALNAERELCYKDLSAADAEVDRIISSLRMHLLALQNYPVDEVSQAARVVWDAIDQYGSPTQLSFSEEYAIVIRMLETLEGVDKDVLNKATVAAWIPTLREKYDVFMALMKSYDSERSSFTPGAIKAARQAQIDAWRSLCEYINSLSIITPSSELDDLIGDMNARIRSKKTSLKMRKAGKKGELSNELPED